MPAFSKICVAALAAGIMGVQADLSGLPDGGGAWSPEMSELVRTKFANAAPTIPAPSIDPKDAAAAWSAYKGYTSAVAPNSKPTSKPSSTSSAKTTMKTTSKTATKKTGEIKKKPGPTPTAKPSNALNPTKLISTITDAIASGDAEELQAKLSMVLPLLKTALPKDVLEVKVKDLVSKIPSSLPKEDIWGNLDKLAKVLLGTLNKVDLEKELEKLKVTFSKLPKLKVQTKSEVERRDEQKTIPSSAPEPPKNGTNGTTTPAAPSPSSRPEDVPNAAAGVSSMMQTLGAVVVGGLVTVLVL